MSSQVPQRNEIQPNRGDRRDQTVSKSQKGIKNTGTVRTHHHLSNKSSPPTDPYPPPING